MILRETQSGSNSLPVLDLVKVHFKVTSFLYFGKNVDSSKFKFICIHYNFLTNPDFPKNKYLAWILVLQFIKSKFYCFFKNVQLNVCHIKPNGLP